MVRAFLDTNYFIDAIHRKPEENILESLLDYSVYVSPLSFHIYCYIYKIKIPNKKVSAHKDKFSLVELSDRILQNALQGPTSDFEDNIQLHSAAEANCDFFLTSDQKLLEMKFFGKVRIADNLF